VKKKSKNDTSEVSFFMIKINNIKVNVKCYRENEIMKDSLEEKI